MSDTTGTTSGGNRMNPEIREQWAQDLESGDYPQSSGYLRTERGFCCLGVLCEQAVRAGVISRFGLSYGTSPEDPEKNATFLPRKVMNWAGLDHADPYVDRRDNNDTCSLSELNDMETSFGVIARLIREQL